MSVSIGVLSSRKNYSVSFDCLVMSLFSIPLMFMIETLLTRSTDTSLSSSGLGGLGLSCSFPFRLFLESLSLGVESFLRGAPSSASSSFSFD